MRRVGLPFGDIVAAADRVAGGDYGTRVVERGPPFLRVVARAFNGMTARLQEQDRQRRDLLADIAHELRTPLAVVQGRLEGVLDGVYPRDDDADWRGARRDADAGAAGRGSRHARARGARRDGAAARSRRTSSLLIYDAVRALEPEARARGRSASTSHVPADLELVDVDPLRHREVVMNLLANAIRHSQPRRERHGHRGGTTAGRSWSRAGQRPGHSPAEICGDLRSLPQRPAVAGLGSGARDRASSRRGARRDDCRGERRRIGHDVHGDAAAHPDGAVLNCADRNQTPARRRPASAGV